MFAPLKFKARRAARKAARKAIYGLVGGLALSIGAGFLLSALWLWLEKEWGAIIASSAIGLGLVVLGLIALSLGRGDAAAASARRTKEAPEAAQTASGSAFSAASMERLQAASVTGQPGDLERAVHGLLLEAGLTPPPQGNLPSLAAALVYGATLAMSRRRP